MCVLEPEQEGRKAHTGQAHPGSRQRPPGVKAEATKSLEEKLGSKAKQAHSLKTLGRWTGRPTQLGALQRNSPGGPRKPEQLTAPAPPQGAPPHAINSPL